MLSCNEADILKKEACVIALSTKVIEHSELPISRNAANNNLLAIQIYELEEDITTPYAHGLFDDWTELSFEGFTNTKYKVVSTMLVGAKSKLKITDNVYGKPFDCTLANDFEYNTEELSALGISTATLANGTMSATPPIDRYYGTYEGMATLSDKSISIPMRRVAFGVKVKGDDESESITLKIAGAPDVNISQDETTTYTFNYIEQAYNANESNGAYSENINTEILRNGTSIYRGNIVFKRNQTTTITFSKDCIGFGFDFETPFEEGIENEDEDIDPTPYVTKVFEYMPAPGQFVNKLPVYKEGDTQETMNAKVLAAIGNGVEQMITLGNYGGYVTLGFDHTIENVAGKLDFRVLGNAFYAAANPDHDNIEGGSCEAGIIMVAYDENKNGVPDDNEWYEIAGSAHKDATQELWYQKGVENNNDMAFYFADFKITYTKPTAEPSKENYASYIPWIDNKGNTGYVEKNTFHAQAYYPQWIEQDSMTFTGSRLPQNGIDESGVGNYFVLYKFRYGYADNETNAKDASAIDISWAVDADGNSVSLPGVDFIKIYNGINQYNGWLGECSTEITGIEDLHLLGDDIASNF